VIFGTLMLGSCSSYAKTVSQWGPHFVHSLHIDRLALLVANFYYHLPLFGTSTD
jgi:hypothetical protein